MFPEKIHRYIYLFGLFGLGFGMMLGAVPTSVPQLILVGNFIGEGDFNRKWQQLKSNTLFWILSSAFLIHILGLAYTHNLAEGWQDVKTKIPLMFLPLIFFSGKPLSLKEFNGILSCFVAGCVANTLWCLLYSFGLHHNEVVRDASRFMSHIRLGLYINLAIATCVYFAVKSESIYRKTGLILLAVYFIFVLYVLGLASGLTNFVILFLLALSVIIYRSKTSIKIAALIVFVTFTTIVTHYISAIKDTQLVVKSTKNNKVQKVAPSGRLYTHFEKNGQKENGNYIQINIQPEELQREWKRQFPSDSFNYFTKTNLERYVVLIRYMTSKGLNKDSAGIAALTEEDKSNIQKDIINYEYPHWSYLHKRTYELINEYDEFVNHRVINGHSLTMRIYFWEAAVQLIKQNALFGVGTGDVQQELNKTYVEIKSPLEVEWYKRPHNQFLTITVALGIFGLIIFLVSIIYPVIILKSYLPKLYWPFFIIAVLSFFLEDTLETQAGCTFFAFFNSLFLATTYIEKQSSDISIQ